MSPPICDCHMHIYGPAERYPAQGAAPAHADVADYRGLQRQLGLARVVVVQPSVYGFDNACTLDAVAQLGEAARAIVVVPPDTKRAKLDALHARGARGVRFHMMQGAMSLPWEALEPIAAAIAPLGWHIQLQMNGHELPSVESRLLALPCPTVIDHIGRFTDGVREGDAGLASLDRLLASGRAWLKISAPYWSEATRPGQLTSAGLTARFLAAAPERLVWATNWPHPSLAERPDDAALMGGIRGWLRAAGAEDRVLAENPAQLYGFT